MGDAHGRVSCVHTLPAGAGGAININAQIFVFDLDIHFLSFRQNRNSCRRSVDAPLGFSGGHTLHAVNATFKFQMSKGALAEDIGDDFLIAAMLAIGCGNNFHLPSLGGGITLIHAEQIARKNGGFIAAGSGAHFKDHIAFIGCVFGQKQNAHFLFKLFNASIKLWLFNFSHLGKLSAARQHFAQAFLLKISLFQGLRTFGHGRKLGIILGVFDEGFARHARRQGMFHACKAFNDTVKFLEVDGCHDLWGQP